MDGQEGRELPAGWAARLAAPIDPGDVQWRVQGTPKPGARCQLVAYIDARTAQDRLDSVLGAAWSFDWQPVAVEGGEVKVAKGVITVAGVSRSDVGTAGGPIEPSKTAVSDAFKRAAVQWGIGRGLYGLPPVWCVLDDRGHIPAEMAARLRDGLARRARGAA